MKKNLLKVLFGQDCKGLFRSNTMLEEQILREYYGVDTAPKSYKEIAARLKKEAQYSHVSEGDVRKVAARGLRKIKRRFR